MSVSNNNFGVRLTQIHEKCAMKIKERKNDVQVKNFNGRKEFILVLPKTVVMHLDEIQVNYVHTYS